MALHGTLLPTVSLLWQLFVWRSVLPGRGLSSCGLQHSQHSLDSTVNKVLKITITIRFLRTNLQRCFKDMNNWHNNRLPKNCYKLPNIQIDFVQSGIIRTNLTHSPFFWMSTLARQHHLLACINIAICGKFFVTNNIEIKILKLSHVNISSLKCH